MSSYFWRLPWCQLCTGETSDVTARSGLLLPASQLGPMRVCDALLMLADPAWDIEVDGSIRRIKNYIFFGSDHGDERGALLYGLIGTCKLNGIDPEAYLHHILRVLPEWPCNKVAELLPWNVDLTS